MEEQLVAENIEHIGGPQPSLEEDGFPTVVSLVRDAEVYVEAFVGHYRSLGCRRIVMLDNGSSDRTVQIAGAAPEVTLMRCGLPFDRFKRAMRRYLTRAYCIHRWCLYVDIDEFFDYPDSDKVGLDRFLSYLEQHRFTAVVAQMLDLFPARLSPTSDVGDLLFRSRHRLYDIAHIERRPYLVPGNILGDPRIEMYYGGIRAAVFGGNPWLTKHPLFFFDDNALPFLEDSHRVEGAHVADVTGVLYHYKFAGDFQARVDRAVREENYYNASHEYRCYASVLRDDPFVELKQKSSKDLNGPNILIDNGFLIASERYKRFAAAHL
jgi:hypothetical protein